jgi:methoxymalonate biosynthesis acyl carrier protein
MSEPAGILRGFLGDVFGNEGPGEDEDIFALGYVSSMFAMELVTFVEEEFGIRVEREDLSLDNFRTVRAMASLVKRRSAAAGGADA